MTPKNLSLSEVEEARCLWRPKTGTCGSTGDIVFNIVPSYVALAFPHFRFGRKLSDCSALELEKSQCESGREET